MKTFIAVYRGNTVTSARLIALSAEPTLVADITARILQEHAIDHFDPVVENLERGRRAALQLIEKEAIDGSPS
jgi:hypothetical protein